MTAHSFAEYIEETQPATIRASHYALAPDVYGIADGYAWAWADDAKGEPVRRSCPDGGEWPYYIGAVPSIGEPDRYAAAGGLLDPRPEGVRILTHDGEPEPYDTNGEPVTLTPAEVREAYQAGRIFETYGEGDLVAYVFADKAERDGAQDAWSEDAADYARRILSDDRNLSHIPDDAAETLVGAWAEANGKRAEHIDADGIRETAEGYRGEWKSAADYWGSFADDTTPEDARGVWWAYVDWDRYAEECESGAPGHYWQNRDHSGHLFDTQR